MIGILPPQKAPILGIWGLEPVKKTLNSDNGMISKCNKERDEQISHNIVIQFKDKETVELKILRIDLDTLHK